MPRPGPEELEAFETDVLAGFVLARAAAGLSDGTISSHVIHVEQVRAWFGRPLGDMEPADADEYFGKVLRGVAKGTRLSLAQAIRTDFLYLEIRHKTEIHQMTGRVVECPIDEMNRPRGRQQARIRIPPAAEQVGRLFAGWREELATCRKFAPAACNYTACKLMAAASPAGRCRRDELRLLSGPAAHSQPPRSQVLQQQLPGVGIVLARPERRHVSRPRLAEVLGDLGLLHDDPAEAVRGLIERIDGELAPGFAGPARQWLLVLPDGGPRTRPRSQATIYAYSAAARPVLQEWGRTYDHLREVTPADIYAALKPMSGYAVLARL